MNRKSKILLKPKRAKRRVQISGADVIRLHRLPRVEVKQINVSARNAAYYDAVAGSVVVDITAIAQGNTGATRIGDTCHLESLLFRGYIFNQVNSATANYVTNTRILFFQYMGDSSVAAKPTIAEMFNVSNANAGTTYGTWSAFDIDYARTYRVIWDRTFTTYGSPAGLLGSTIGSSAPWHTSIPLARIQRDIQFQAGATTGNNHVFLAITSDQATAATNPLISYNLDVRFTDQ